MNDRFKFRVWDTDIKEYLVGEFLVGGCGDMIHNVVDYESFLNKGNYIIEQCTGRKDKNGNLIYEGDIIKFCVNWRAYVLSYTRIVAWDKNTCGFIMLNAKNQVKPLQKWKFPDPDTHIIEIVGNLHNDTEAD